MYRTNCVGCSEEATKQASSSCTATWVYVRPVLQRRYGTEASNVNSFHVNKHAFPSRTPVLVHILVCEPNDVTGKSVSRNRTGDLRSRTKIREWEPATAIQRRQLPMFSSGTIESHGELSIYASIRTNTRGREEEEDTPVIRASYTTS